MSLLFWQQHNLVGPYEIFDWRSGSSILAVDYKNEFNEIVSVLQGFRLKKSAVLAAGGGKSQVSSALDSAFYALGWREHKFNIDITVDQNAVHVPTHKVDCFKAGIALEVEWNNKDPFFDRDLNNFRVLFELRTVGVGVIITRATHLQKIFDRLGKGSSYGNSTTHWDKLIPRIRGNGAGGCPVVAIGITENLFDENA